MDAAYRTMFTGCVLVGLTLLIGCRTAGHSGSLLSHGLDGAAPDLPDEPPPVSLPTVDAGADQSASNATPSPIQTVALSQPIAEDSQLPTPPADRAERLEVEPLVAQVLSLNPDIRSATAAWRAAAQRYPQVVALDDPMFGYMLGPASWGSDDVESAYMLEASQKIPWPGKRQLRGSIARAEANAAYFDIQEQRLRIAEAARLAYYQYFLAHRQLAVLEESTALLRSFRDIALRKFESAEAEQQDVLLADVELAQLERQRLSLARAERVARARINTLLLVAPDNPLPAPPGDLELRKSLPSSDQLLDLSLAERPELAAQAARIRRERYSAALARKEFLPDMELVARYDAFWQEEPLRPMIGMNFNVPIYKQKRWAALREANARGGQQQAALDSKVVEISFQLEQAYQRVRESAETVEVYKQRILPTARHSIEAAQVSYIAGRLDFLRLIESQRQLLLFQDRYYESVAEYYGRLAELERQVGMPVGL